jgi:hypothetical protein
MPPTVLLKDIVDALEMQFDEYSSYLDLDTGKVETVSNPQEHCPPNRRTAPCTRNWGCRQKSSDRARIYVHVSQDHVDGAMKVNEASLCQFGANTSAKNGKSAATRLRL